MTASASNGWPPPPPSPPWTAQTTTQTPKEHCYIKTTARTSRRRIVRTPPEVGKTAYAAARTTGSTPSANVTTKQQQSPQEELKPTWPNTTYTFDHNNKAPHPQNGKTDPADNTSCQTHPEAHARRYDDPNHCTTNQKQSDSLRYYPTIYSLATQQQINKDSSILNLTQADHRSNRQPDRLDEIEEEILQSLAQMSGHSTTLTNQAPIDFDKMIQALERRIHEMNVNTAPYPPALPTTNAHNKTETPPTPIVSTKDDSQTHPHTAHDQPAPNTIERILQPPHTSKEHPNYSPCRKYPPQLRSSNNNHASTNTRQTAIKRCVRRGSKLLHFHPHFSQAPIAGYAFHHLLPPSKNSDDRDQSTSPIRADIRQVLQPLTEDITTFLTTANTHATALLSQLQRLIALSTTIYTIIVPSARSHDEVSTKYTVKTRQHGPTTQTAFKHVPNSTINNAAASGNANSPTQRDPQENLPLSRTQRHNNMAKPPCVGVHPTALIELQTSSPHSTQLTTQQDYNIRPTSRNTTPQKAAHTKTTTTAADERPQNPKIPYEWKEFPRPLALTHTTEHYLPPTDRHHTAKLRPHTVPPHTHSKNTNCGTHHTNDHFTTNHRTTDYSNNRLVQLAFYHKANLRPP